MKLSYQDSCVELQSGDIHHPWFEHLVVTNAEIYFLKQTIEHLRKEILILKEKVGENHYEQCNSDIQRDANQDGARSSNSPSPTDPGGEIYQDYIDRCTNATCDS